MSATGCLKNVCKAPYIKYALDAVACLCCRIVEVIPKHITPKGGFESMAEFIAFYTSGFAYLAATRDLKKGEEVYLEHERGAVEWSCFHAEGCTSSKLLHCSSPLKFIFIIIAQYLVWLVTYRLLRCFQTKFLTTHGTA